MVTLVPAVPAYMNPYTSTHVNLIKTAIDELQAVTAGLLMVYHNTITIAAGTLSTTLTHGIGDLTLIKGVVITPAVDCDMGNQYPRATNLTNTTVVINVQNPPLPTTTFSIEVFIYYIL